MDNSMKHHRLQELDLSDFQIVKEDPDIRGWDIKTTGGQEIGEVDELIIDARERKVRYLIADLNRSAGKKAARKVLLPIGLATLDKEDDDVLISDQIAAKLDTLPAYDKDHLDEDIERRICETLGFDSANTGSATAQEVVSEHYRHDYFNDDNLYKNRLHEARPARNSMKESEYQHGLKLWEQRSQGGIIGGSASGDSGTEREAPHAQQEQQQAGNRMGRPERRAAYEARKRNRPSRASEQSDHRSVEQRIRDEGLQDG